MDIKDFKAFSRGLIRASNVLKKNGRPQSELSLLERACENHAEEPTLRALFFAAKRAHNVRKAASALKQLETLYQEDPAKLEWVRKARKGSIELLDLTAPLQAPSRSLSYEPVPNRIMYVLHSSLPYSSNGYSTRSHGMAVGMARGGIDLVCITRPGFPFDLFPDNTPPYDVHPFNDVESIRYHHLSEPSRKQFNTPRDYLHAASQVMQKKILEFRPACVIAASNHTPALPACLAARALGIPFIYEVRGFWEITRLSREPEFAAHPSFKDQVFLESETAKAAEHVLTLTVPMKEELIRRGVAPEKITLVPNSCDPSRFTPRPRDAALAAKYGIPADVPVIGYIGSFVQYEGLEHLAQACTILRNQGQDFRLLLVGSEKATGNDRGPITEEILRVANEEGLADKLILPGRIPHEEVEAHYSLIDIAPFPRKPQPVTEMVSPLKPLEALAMEKAVMVSSVRALTEMIKDGETGLVFEKGNVEDMAKVLTRLIADPGLRLRLGKAGRKWVEEERTWQKTASAVSGILSRIAAEHTPCQM